MMRPVYIYSKAKQKLNILVSYGMKRKLFFVLFPLSITRENIHNVRLYRKKEEFCFAHVLCHVFETPLYFEIIIFLDI